MSEGEINTIFEDSQAAITLQNAFFDTQNFDDPVRYYLDDSFFWDLLPGFRKKVDMHVRQGKANLLDDLVQLFSDKSQTYYTVANTKEQIVLENSEDEFLSVFIRLDSTAETYDRRVYSISDLLAQVGGIYQSVFFIGVLFIGIFSERMFISSILRKIYQLDTIRENQMKEKKHLDQKQSKYNDQEHQDSNKSSQSVHLSQIKIENENNNEVDPNEIDMVKKSLSYTINLVDGKEKGSAQDQDRKRRIFESLKFLLFNRELFKYSFKDIVEYML